MGCAALCAAGLLAGPADAGAAGVGRGQAVGPRIAYPRTQSPANGQTVSGRITWRVAVHGARPRRVEFAVDGALMARFARFRAPSARRAATTLDTTQLSNGPHTLTAIAYGPTGPAAGQLEGHR